MKYRKDLFYKESRKGGTGEIGEDRARGTSERARRRAGGRRSDGARWKMGRWNGVGGRLAENMAVLNYRHVPPCTGLYHLFLAVNVTRAEGTEITKEASSQVELGTNMKNMRRRIGYGRRREEGEPEVGKGGRMMGKWISLSHFETALTRFGPDNSTQVVDFPHLVVVRIFWEAMKWPQKRGNKLKATGIITRTWDGAAGSESGGAKKENT